MGQLSNQPITMKDDQMQKVQSTVWLLLILVLVQCLTLPAFAENGNIDKRDRVCMMQDSVMEKAGVPVQYMGKTYYGCCPMCSDRITSEPEKYTKALDPVTHATVDKATALIYGYNGHAYYFNTESSRAAFAATPDRYVSSEVSH